MLIASLQTESKATPDDPDGVTEDRQEAILERMNESTAEPEEEAAPPVEEESEEASSE